MPSQRINNPLYLSVSKNPETFIHFLVSFFSFNKYIGMIDLIIYQVNCFISWNSLPPGYQIVVLIVQLKHVVSQIGKSAYLLR